MAPPRLSPRADVAIAAAALAAGEADAMIALDRPVVAGALAAHPELRLVEFAGWWRGAARLALLPRRDATRRSGPEPIPTAGARSRRRPCSGC